MAPAPARSVFKQQSRVLADLKSFSPDALRRVETIRVTNVAGLVMEEAWPGLQLPERSIEEVAALAALAALRKTDHKDAQPAAVAPALYIGGSGAARNLKALRKRGITHILNAAPCVPCHFKDNPEGCFTYLTVPLFDDPSADLLTHLEACNAFIAEGRRHGGVLVHCYAGQSRSAALVMAHLIASEGMGLMDAWAAARRARPCAHPNPGFLRQLAVYAKRHAESEAAFLPGTSPTDSEPELELHERTQ